MTKHCLLKEISLPKSNFFSEFGKIRKSIMERTGGNVSPLLSQLLSPIVGNVTMSMIYFGGFLSGISKLEIWNMGNPLTWGSSLLGKAVMPYQKLNYPATVLFNLQIDIDSSIRVLFNVLLFSSTVSQLCEADCWVWSLGVALCFEFLRMSENFLHPPLAFDN